MKSVHRHSGHALAAALALVLLIAIATLQSRGPGLLVEVYGVDTLFVLDVLERTARGETPHSDFTLHLGALPFALVSLMSSDSVTGFMRAQWALAAALIAAGAYLAHRRLAPFATGLLLIYVVLVATALSTLFDPRITLALFYNRWAWAIAIVFITAILIRPPAGVPALLDNVLVGCLAMGLLTTKVTFFAVLVPLGVLFYAMDGRWRDIGSILATALVIAGLVAVAIGPGFWLDYLENLIWVAENPIRKTAGETLWQTATTTTHLAHFLAFGLFVGLVGRSAGLGRGFLFAALGAGFLVLQNQNFGHVPAWGLAMVPLALAWCAKAPKGSSGAAFAIVAAAFALILLLPLYIAAQSSFRAAKPFPDGAAQMVPGSQRLARISVTAPQAGPVVEVAVPPGEAPPEHLGTCHATSGFLQVFHGVAEELSRLDGPVFVADAQSMYWMQNGTQPLPGAAPWNYGSLRGLDEAGYVAIPRCPFKPSYQRVILQRMEQEGITLTPVTKGNWVTLLTWARPIGN